MTIHVISVNRGKKGGSKLFTKVWGLKLVHFWDRTTLVYVTSQQSINMAGVRGEKLCNLLVHFWDRTTLVYVTSQQSINMAGVRGEKLCNLICNLDHTTNLLPREENIAVV